MAARGWSGKDAEILDKHDRWFRDAAAGITLLHALRPRGRGLLRIRCYLAIASRHGIGWPDALTRIRILAGYSLASIRSRKAASGR